MSMGEDGPREGGGYDRGYATTTESRPIPSVPRGDLIERAEKQIAIEREPRDLAPVHITVNTIDQLVDTLNRLIETAESRFAPVLTPNAMLVARGDDRAVDPRPNASPLTDRLSDVARRVEYGIHRLSTLLETSEV